MGRQGSGVEKEDACERPVLVNRNFQELRKSCNGSKNIHPKLSLEPNWEAVLNILTDVWRTRSECVGVSSEGFLYFMLCLSHGTVRWTHRPSRKGLEVTSDCPWLWSLHKDQQRVRLVCWLFL